MLAAIPLLVLGLALACAMCLACHYRRKAEAAERLLVTKQVELDHLRSSLRDFQLEQTELLLKSAEGKAVSEEPSRYEMDYVYRSLGMVPRPRSQ